MTRIIQHIVAFALVLGLGTAQAGEITDFSTTDASNTNSTYGFPENMAASAVNDNLRAVQGILARWHKDWNTSVVSYGSANAIRITPNRTIGNLYDGLMLAFEVTTSNTSTTTLQVGTLTAKEIKKAHDNSLASGDLESGQKIIVVYNADEDVFQLVTPTAAATLTDPMTTRGDILVRDSSNTTSRLGVGSANTVLTSDGTDPSWGSVTTGIIASGVTGSLLSWNTDQTAYQITPGISGHVLISQGPTGTPRFNKVPALSTPDFESSEQTVTFDTVLDVAHSLGVTPTFVTVVLRNKTTEHGYAVGDEVLAPTVGRTGVASDAGVNVSVDSSNVTIVQGVGVDVISQSSLNGVVITVGNWKWVVRAWK